MKLECFVSRTNKKAGGSLAQLFSSEQHPWHIYENFIWMQNNRITEDLSFYLPPLSIPESLGQVNPSSITMVPDCWMFCRDIRVRCSWNQNLYTDNNERKSSLLRSQVVLKMTYFSMGMEGRYSSNMEWRYHISFDKGITTSYHGGGRVKIKNAHMTSYQQKEKKSEIFQTEIFSNQTILEFSQEMPGGQLGVGREGWVINNF